VSFDVKQTEKGAQADNVRAPDGSAFVREGGPEEMGGAPRARRSRNE
jgi:hypothetical protein